MGGTTDTKEEHGGNEPQQHQDKPDNGHTGHGAASALAQLNSQGRKDRRPAGEADDAAGAGRQ